MPFHTVPCRSIPFHTTTFQYIVTPLHTNTSHYIPSYITHHCMPMLAVTLRCIAMQCVTLRRYIACLTLHCITLHHITIQHITSHYTTLHYITLRCVTLHYITIHYINYITLNYNTIHYIMTLQYATLHYICACTKPPRIKLPSHSRCLSTHWYLAKVSGHFIYLSTSTQQHVCEITHSNSNTRLACMHTDIDRHRQT
jgi:hypothetical protein